MTDKVLVERKHFDLMFDIAEKNVRLYSMALVGIRDDDYVRLRSEVIALVSEFASIKQQIERECAT